MQDMQCMLQISPTRLLLGGHQDKIIDFNLTRGKESGLVSTFVLVRRYVILISLEPLYGSTLYL